MFKKLLGRPVSLQVVIPELLSNTTSMTMGQKMSPGDPPRTPVSHTNTSVHPLSAPAGHNATESGGQLSDL